MEHQQKPSRNHWFPFCIAVGILAGLWLLLMPALRLVFDSWNVLTRGWNVLDGVGVNLLKTLRLLVWVLLLSVPLAFGAAVWLHEYTTPATKRRCREILRQLSFCPSVLLGLLARMLLVPYIGTGLLSLVLLLSVFCLPFLVSRYEHALSEVPASVRLMGLSLGASRSLVLWKLVLPKTVAELSRSTVKCMERILGEATAVLALLGAVPADSTLSVELFRLAWIGRQDAALLALLLGGCLVCLRLLTAERWDHSTHEPKYRPQD